MMLLLPHLGLGLHITTAAANSAMRHYLHNKGPKGMDESNCIGSRYLVVVYTTRKDNYSLHTFSGT
jgi:hypothetical protein